MKGQERLRPLRAFAHPLRLRLLSLLTGQSQSAAEVARSIGGTQANASYHLRVLHAAGLLKIVDQESVRGGQTVRYRHDPRSGDEKHTGGAEGYALLAELLAEELRCRSAQREQGHPGLLSSGCRRRGGRLSERLSRRRRCGCMPPRDPSGRRARCG